MTSVTPHASATVSASVTLSLSKGAAAVLASAFIAAAAPAHAAAAKRPVAAEDLFKMQLVSTATISPDGRHVAFVVSKPDLEKNTYLNNIWLAESDGSRVVQLTRGDHDGEPAWSPDSRTLVFTGARGGPPQLFAIDVAGAGEARRLTHQPSGATTANFSHDGKRIAFNATTVDEAPASRVDWKALGIKPPAKLAKSDIRTLPWPRYQANGAGPIYDKHQHIWTADADGANPKQLTNTPDGEAGADWSPDDRSIAYSAVPISDVEGDRGNVWIVSSAGGAPVKFSSSHYGTFEVAWTHDGKRIVDAYFSRHDSAGLPAIASAKLDGSDERTHVAENTLLLGDVVINDTKEGGNGCGILTPDDTAFIADVSVPGATEIDSIDLATGKSTTLVGGGREIMDCSLSRDGRTIAFTAIDATHLAEISVFDRTSGATRQLTHLNDALTGSLDVSVPEQHSVSNGQGGSVMYWVLKPPNAVPGRRYPTILDIHGGPHTEFGNSFFHEFQVMAARGYTVVYANPRGSVGYGYAWAEALDGNWGDAMFADESAVMDEVAKRDDVDTAHTFVSGGSYGGYATLWVIAHTNRFKAAIAERPVSNIFTETLTADFAAPRGFEGAAGTAGSWGGPLQGRAVIWQQSPLAHVANVHTPLLLLHADGDSRAPLAETLQEYEALKMLGRLVTLVQVPRDNHDLTRTGEPIHRVERLHLIADWLGTFLRR
jgi:dipeptidyl aminopeptidase/acylaminoacyl peptidase